MYFDLYVSYKLCGRSKEGHKVIEYWLYFSKCEFMWVRTSQRRLFLLATVKEQEITVRVSIN
jgi:hypothetical protein